MIMEKLNDKELLDIYCKINHLDFMVTINKEDRISFKNNVKETLGFQVYKLHYYFTYLGYQFLKNIRFIK